MRGLRDRGLLVLHSAGASSYFELSEKLRSAPGASSAVPEAVPDRGELQAGLGGSPAAIGGSSDSDSGELSKRQQELVAGLGKRPRKPKLRAAMLALMTDRWWTPSELAAVLGRDPDSLVEDHLGPMVREGSVERKHSEPNHPMQAYRSYGGPLFARRDDESEAKPG